MDKIKVRLVLIAIVFAVGIGASASAGVYVYTTQIADEKIGYWTEESDFWESLYNLERNNVVDLEYDYDVLLDDYNDLVDDYNSLYSPCTLIKDGEINWRFNTLDDDIATWTVDIDTYAYYVQYPEPTKYESLYNSGNGETYYVKDLTKYVEPDFFSGVISGLTKGNSDEEFVAEVVNLKNQLISYGSGLGDTYQWSAETLTEGRGKCGDTSILVASLLKAGENEANYGLDIYIWYCDLDNMNDPQDVNHAIVGVEYSDGSSELIETTSDDYYSHNQIFGWRFEV